MFLCPCAPAFAHNDSLSHYTVCRLKHIITRPYCTGVYLVCSLIRDKINQLGYHLYIGFLEKSRLAEGCYQVLLQLPNLKVACQTDQEGAEVKVGGFPVEALQALNQLGRNDERRVGILTWIADEQTGPVPHRGRHEIEVYPEAGERLRHCLPSYREAGTSRRLLLRYTGRCVF